MSDEPNGKASERATIPAGIFTHYCEHPGCREWGSFGEPHGRETRWFCAEHRNK